MDSPQKKDGYTPIDNELLEQIFQSSLNGTQFRIILVVSRYTYGFARQQHELSETFISKVMNVHKKQVSRELNELITKGIILVDREATFTTPRLISINKKFADWKLNDRQVTNQLPPNELEDGTGSGLATSTGSGLAPQENKILNKNLNKDIKKHICDYQQIIDLFHSICVSYSKVTKLTPARKRTIEARSKNYTVEDFQKLFTMAQESKFLKGEVESKDEHIWKANFDWLINESNMVKVLEGNYKNKTSSPKAQQSNNKFNQFPQRTYTAQDYANLEKELINKSSQNGDYDGTET